MDIKDLGEFGLIERIRKSLIGTTGADIVGIGDDCAVIPKDEKTSTLLTTDLLVEGIHFNLAHCSACQLGYKSLAVNLSDIAAMGGIPGYGLISLAIPPATTVEFMDEFYQGMSELAGRFGVQIIGGDTTHSNSGFVINIALIGEIEKGREIYRFGARPGDLICATGYLGNSAAGLHLMSNHPEELPDFEELAENYRQPYPHIKQGRILSESGAVRAMIDISDGLASDLGHICGASGCGAEIYEELLPISSALSRYTRKHNLDYLELSLGGGEDYCLLFTIESEKFTEVNQTLNNAGYEIYNIGEISAADNIYIVNKDGGREILKIKGWDHFKK